MGSLTSLANGPLTSTTAASVVVGNSAGIALSAPVDLNASQLGLAGIITPTTLNNHQARNLITIPGVNLAGAIGAAPAKVTGVTSVSGATGHKNNNIFKDLNFVVTGLDSSSLVNGQVVNITPAQLAELAGNQGQTLLFNNFPVSATSNNAISSAAAQTTSNISSVTTVAPPRPSKRHRGSSGSRSQSSLNSNKITPNPLEGFKIIPANNVITSGQLPPNTVLMDGGSLQGAVLTSVTLAGGAGAPTLVAISSTAASSNDASVTANPTGQILCAVRSYIFQLI